MFSHYLKTAIRNLAGSKIVSIISIAGYTIGLTSALLILLYVLNETSFDRYHKNRKCIYRVLVEYVDSWEQPLTQYILAPTLKSNFPERIYADGADRKSYWMAGCLLHHGQMVAEFCLPYTD